MLYLELDAYKRKICVFYFFSIFRIQQTKLAKLVSNEVFANALLYIILLLLKPQS